MVTVTTRVLAKEEEMIRDVCYCCCYYYYYYIVSFIVLLITEAVRHGMWTRMYNYYLIKLPCTTTTTTTTATTVVAMVKILVVMKTKQ